MVVFKMRMGKVSRCRLIFILDVNQIMIWSWLMPMCRAIMPASMPKRMRMCVVPSASEDEEM